VGIAIVAVSAASRVYTIRMIAIMSFAIIVGAQIPLAARRIEPTYVLVMFQFSVLLE